MRMIVCVCALVLCFGCGKRMTGTYELELPTISMPASPILPDTKADARWRRQLDDAIRLTRELGRMRLTFEGRKARVSNWGGMEVLVPYRVKAGRVEILLAQGETEQIMAFTINPDGSLHGALGRFVRIK